MAEKKSNITIKVIANIDPEEIPINRIKAEEILIPPSKGSESTSKIDALIKNISGLAFVRMGDHHLPLQHPVPQYSFLGLSPLVLK